MHWVPCASVGRDPDPDWSCPGTRALYEFLLEVRVPVKDTRRLPVYAPIFDRKTHSSLSANNYSGFKFVYLFTLLVGRFNEMSLAVTNEILKREYPLETYKFLTTAWRTFWPILLYIFQQG